MSVKPSVSHLVMLVTVADISFLHHRFLQWCTSLCSVHIVTDVSTWCMFFIWRNDFGNVSLLVTVVGCLECSCCQKRILIGWIWIVMPFFEVVFCLGMSMVMKNETSSLLPLPGGRRPYICEECDIGYRNISGKQYRYIDSTTMATRCVLLRRYLDILLTL